MKTTENTEHKNSILGDEPKAKPAVKAQLEAVRKAKMGEIVFYSFNTEEQHPAIVRRVHESGAVDLAVMMDTFVEFTKKTPYSKEKAGRTFDFK